MIEFLLTLSLITTLVLSYLERKDLYDRLMSRDFREYKDNTAKDEPNKEPIPDETIPVEDALDEIYKDMNG